jgi:hypothetical protein
MITPSFGLAATERVLPRLSIDFTGSVLDPRITLTRAGTTATRVNSTGVIEGVAADTPRFDFNPITLACRGLLIEQTQENLLTYSGDFSNPVWLTSGGATSAVTITNPDATTAGVLFTEDAALSFHTVNRSRSFTSGVLYTYSVFVKTNGRNVIEVGAGNTGVWGGRVRFNIALGTILASTGSGTITPYPNGWYRCTVTGTAGSTASTTLNVRGFDLIANSATYTGDGFSGFYVWGAQFEQNPFPTSYIPTDAATATRNADLATMTGTDFSDWYSAGAGGLVVRVRPSTVVGTRPAIQFDDNTANEIIALQGNTTNPELSIVDGGSPQAQIDAGTIAANTAYNLGGAWDTNNCAAAVNGGAAVTDTSATIPTVTQARLGSDGTNYLNGHLQTVRYWPQRLTNAEVQAFSK